MAGVAEGCAPADGRSFNQQGAAVGRCASLRAATKQTLQEAKRRMSGIAFDAGGLIALDRNDRRVMALVARASERGMRITIPATALAQAIRNPARQSRLSRLIRQPGTDLVPLDGPDAPGSASCWHERLRLILPLRTLSFVRSALSKQSSPATPTISGELPPICDW